MLSISFKCEIIIPTLYQLHPGEEMREKTTSRAIRRACTSCHLSAQSPLLAGITAPLLEGRRGAQLSNALVL